LRVVDDGDLEQRAVGQQCFRELADEGDVVAHFGRDATAGVADDHRLTEPDAEDVRGIDARVEACDHEETQVGEHDCALVTAAHGLAVEKPRMSRRFAWLCAITALAACTPAGARAATTQNGLFLTMPTTVTGAPPTFRVGNGCSSSTRAVMARNPDATSAGAAFVAPSLDGRRFAFLNVRGLWVATIGLRHRHDVLRGRGGTRARPGRRLAVLVGSRLLNVRANGRDVEVLARVTHAAVPVGWPRDGQSVAFLRCRFSERRRRGVPPRDRSPPRHGERAAGHRRQSFQPGRRCGRGRCGPGSDPASAAWAAWRDGGGHDSGLRDRRGAGCDGLGHHCGPRHGCADHSHPSCTCWS
jgi:hypothetical protein